jgi:formylglycine-generating enzyme required for sulfatase activity
VGAFTNSASHYGTYDQEGDVFQWNERLLQVNSRGLRGGGWYGGWSILQASGRSLGGPAGASYDIGFRVASSTIPPTILATGVIDVTGSSAVLTGTINPNGALTSAYFLYGTSSNYSSQSPVQIVGSGISGVALSSTITGLTSETQYHFSLVATTASGNGAQSPDATFTSGAAAGVALSLISNPGNSPDPITGRGEVDFPYSIGTFDVTEAQYCTFLNAVATTADPCGLYTPGLATTNGTSGGIAQSGTLGSYSYSVIGNTGNDPVTYVSWLDAARFCNWMQNGEPDSGVENAASTEQGAYTLNGDTSSGLETENPGATWWIPSEDQWYKAAYYDPTLGGSGGYWVYPTRSNSAPGNAVGSGANEANYYTEGGYSVTRATTYSISQNYLTPVGAFTSSASYYGTYDQGGDVFQWNDAIFHGTFRGIRGGSWASESPLALQSSSRYPTTPTVANAGLGFRVASAATPSISPAILGSGVASLTGSTAIVDGTVNANGADTLVYVQYGTSPSYGSNTASQDIGSGFGNIAVSSTLTGLSAVTPYYYQVVAINASGTTYGQASSLYTSPPIANHVYVTLTNSSATTVRPLATDSDPNGFPLTITAISEPSLGSAAIAVSGTSITYTPSLNFRNYAGNDTFTYTIGNSHGGTATGEITVGNPFYVQKGNFAGTLSNSGGGYLTLTVTSSGLFTGKLRLSGVTSSFEGTFNSSGAYFGTPGGVPLSLQLNIANLTGQAFGRYTVTGTCNSVALTAFHALYNSTSNPSPEVGAYTVLLPAVDPTDPATPSGTGYATLSVSEAGNVTITGNLSDGTTFTDGVFITGGTNAAGDSFPIYSKLAYKVPGSLIGTITFEEIAATDGTNGTDCDGSVEWVKPAQTHTAFYADGFSTSLAASGSRYAEPPFGTLALNLGDSDPNATISLTEPDFVGEIHHQLFVAPGRNTATDTVTVTDPTSDGLTLSIDAANGTFSGSFVHPITNKRVTVKGAILYNQTQAAGFFLSPTQSGNVIISP